MNAEIVTLRSSGDNYIYLIVAGDAAAAVDPGEAEPVEREVARRGLGLAAVLLTHHHADHTAGAGALKRRYGSAVIGPAGAAGVDRAPADDAAWPLGPAALRCLHVPGHTAGHLAFLVDDAAVFTGDTLFAGGCGRIFECDAARMWRSLVKLGRLPDHLQVYCGHEYTVENYEFAHSLLSEDAAIAGRLAEVRMLIAEGKPTVPSTIGMERRRR